MTYVKLNHAPLRVDFGGGWLDVPQYAIPGAFIVNCAVSPVVTLDSWPYEQRGGLGGSAAYALLKGRDALQEELNRAGWQDPAIVMETGLCVWRSGPAPILEAKYNPGWLEGLMALRWTGEPHDTEILRDKKRDYKLIASAGLAAYQACQAGSYVITEKPSWRIDEAVKELARAVHLSHMAQQDEGMVPIAIHRHKALAAKYCGSGWGGYILYLFADHVTRNLFVETNVNAKAIEPYMRSVQSSVLLWHE